MNYKVFAFIVCVMPFAYGAENQTVVNQTFVPDATSRAYTVMVEAGAKLLEFDIIRARVNAQEKSLVATLQHEQFTSTAGKALGVLGPLEQLAHGFDDVIPAFLVLQNAVTESAATDAVKIQISYALNGLVAVLAAPEVLHAVLPQPELVGASYRDAMTYAPTAVFIKTIQAIVYKKFMYHYCDENNQIVNQQQLTHDAYLFYAIVSKAIVNMFGDLMKAPTVASSVKVEPKVTVETKITDDKQQKHVQAEVKPVAKAAAPVLMAQDKKTQPVEAAKPIVVKVEPAKPILSPDEMLHQAILHDSAKEVEEAVKAGADVNYKKDGKMPLFITLALKRFKAAESLLNFGSRIEPDYIGHSTCNTVWQNVKDLARSSLDAKLFLLIYKSGAQDFLDVDTTFELLRKPGNVDIVLELLENLMSPKNLIKKGSNIETEWKNLLNSRFASYALQDAFIKFFIKMGVDVNKIFDLGGGNGIERCYTSLIYFAIGQGNVNAVKTLISLGSKLSQEISFWPGNENVNCPGNVTPIKLKPFDFAIYMRNRMGDSAEKRKNFDAIVELLV